jgi:hypothetical protein
MKGGFFMSGEIMISQQRFEELIALAKKCGLHINEAIKLAVHESLEIERAKSKSIKPIGIEYDANWSD